MFPGKPIVLTQRQLRKTCRHQIVRVVQMPGRGWTRLLGYVSRYAYRVSSILQKLTDRHFVLCDTEAKY